MRNVKLSITKTQTKNGRDESSFIVTVSYDVATETVDSIHSVVVYNHERKCTTDLTAIFSEQFDSELDSIIDNTDWRQVYTDTYHEEPDNYKEERAAHFASMPSFNIAGFADSLLGNINKIGRA